MACLLGCRVPRQDTPGGLVSSPSGRPRSTGRAPSTADRFSASNLLRHSQMAHLSHSLSSGSQLTTGSPAPVASRGTRVGPVCSGDRPRVDFREWLIPLAPVGL